jgi:acetyl-CoA carboxylase carboxyl transferase subunit alpha
MATDHELRLRERLTRLRNLNLLGGTRVSGELEKLQRQLERIQSAPTDEEIWRSVELARHQDRPYTLDYVNRLLDDWVELHGDRGRADDHALVIGLGRFEGRTIALVGNQKGRDIKERSERNFGMAYPEGYRKAMRLMELAERNRFPLISLVDIPGAYPGVAAEQHGQGGMIARSQALMARLGVPIVTCVIGEGGSGGALAIGVADRVLMLEHAIYSVISPEGCATILWRDVNQRKKAAAAFKPTARFSYELGVVDTVVSEPSGGAHKDHDRAARLLGDAVAQALESIEAEPVELRRAARRAKFRRMGVWLEDGVVVGEKEPDPAAPPLPAGD